MNNKRREVLNKVLAAIKSGEIVQGDQLLPERELIPRLGISRQHLRDALIALDALGIVDVRDRQGVFVQDQRSEFIFSPIESLSMWPADLYSQAAEVRKSLEIPAAGFAAERCSEEDIENLQKVIKEMKSLYEKTGGRLGDEGTKLNSILHNIIINATHNKLMIKVYETISVLIKDSIVSVYNHRGMTYPFDVWPEKILNEHENVVEAITRRDKKNAEEAMSYHLNKFYLEQKNGN